MTLFIASALRRRWWPSWEYKISTAWPSCPDQAISFLSPQMVKESVVLKPYEYRLGSTRLAPEDVVPTGNVAVNSGELVRYASMSAMSCPTDTKPGHRPSPAVCAVDAPAPLILSSPEEWWRLDSRARYSVHRDVDRGALRIGAGDLAVVRVSPGSGQEKDRAGLAVSASLAGRVKDLRRHPRATYSIAIGTISSPTHHGRPPHHKARRAAESPSQRPPASSRCLCGLPPVASVSLVL